MAMSMAVVSVLFAGEAFSYGWIPIFITIGSTTMIAAAPVVAAHGIRAFH